MYPIKYIDNNLVWNKDNEVFAYYELIPYNYSFLSAEQKFIVHDSFRQLIAQSREGKIHALQIATESSIRSIQEQSKRLVTGRLKDVAFEKIDEQTEALVSMIGDNQVDYRFFLGFKLMVTDELLNLQSVKKSVFMTFKEFLHEVNHTLMNDFVSMPDDEINRYLKMEKLLENKISRRFKVRRLETACELAISRGIKVPRYHHLKAILTANQDITYKEQLDSESSFDDSSMGYLRGSDYYREGGDPDGE